MDKKILLVDMDSVLADFEVGFLKKWKELYPRDSFINIKDRKSFHIKDDYPQNLKANIEDIYNEKGFILNLPEVPNAIDSVKQLSKKYDIFICTTALSGNPTAVEEKYKWIETHIGFDWTKKIILTKDKTIIRGDFLIDDRPEVKGILKPTWIHLLFDVPYNKHIKTSYRINWENYSKYL